MSGTTLDAASVGDDRRGLLRSSSVSQDKPGLEFSEISCAQLFHSDRLVIELAIFHGVVTVSDSTELHLCLSAGRLGRPGSMKPNGVST